MTSVFSLDDFLPELGQTYLLEASAGTGKTYTLSFMVAKSIVAGTPLDRILGITFARDAAQELHHAVYQRLCEWVQALGHDMKTVDHRISALCSALSHSQRAVVYSRIKAALHTLDRASFFTIHGFAQRMTSDLGLLAGHDPGVRVTSSAVELVDQVIDDVYVEALHHDCAIRYREFKKEHKKLLTNSRSDVHFSGYAPIYAQLAAQELAYRKSLSNSIDFNDMLARLKSAVHDCEFGQTACDYLRHRFHYVFVDEFQDTDADQWDIIRRVFVDHSAVMLIGDPKQSIYAFRGADIATYLRVRNEPFVQSFRLDTNYRSDRAVVDGVSTLFGQTSLSADASQPICAEPIKAYRTDSAVISPKMSAAVQIRAIEVGDRWPDSDASFAMICEDLVSQVDSYINGYQIADASGKRRINYSDIAILVNTHVAEEYIVDLLNARGHHAVKGRAEALYESKAASDWLALLEAMIAPYSTTISQALLTPFFGWTSDTIIYAPIPVEMLTRASAIAQLDGLGAVFDYLMTNPSRDSAPTKPDDRELDQLRQIGFLLAAQHNQHDLAGIRDFLKRRIDHPHIAEISDSDSQNNPSLLTDKPIIRVMTIHQAKGLQFPIVLLPQASLFGPFDTDPSTCAEALRLFYVACTRAQSLLRIWWCPHAYDARNRPATSFLNSPIQRLLLNQGAAQIPPIGLLNNQHPTMPHTSSLDTVMVDDEHRSSPHDDLSDLELAHRDAPTPRIWTDPVDRAWVRTSYSGLTRGLHDLASPAPVEFTDDELQPDEPIAANPPVATSPDLHSPASMLADLPGGTVFGSLVHSIFEQVDPAGEDLRADLGSVYRRMRTQFPVDDIDDDAMVNGLYQALMTKLGKLTDGLSLRDLGAKHRLAELEFEIPLGDRGRQSLNALAKTFTDFLPADDPLYSYGRSLASTPAASTQLAGFMTGSIDAVLQIPHSGRYVIVDYKTNRIGTSEHLTSHDYNPIAMAQMMQDCHYPLQALIYSVALHRFLSWRRDGYDPSRHLGPVGYLFVRGMAGEDNPTIGGMPAGVFIWHPPFAMIEQASTILSGVQP